MIILSRDSIDREMARGICDALAEVDAGRELRSSRRAIDLERGNRPGWWYVAFGEGPDFLAACIVQGQGPHSALDRATRLGLNPGGPRVLVAPIPGETPPPAVVRDRRLSRGDLDQHLEGWVVVRGTGGSSHAGN